MKTVFFIGKGKTKTEKTWAREICEGLCGQIKNGKTVNKARRNGE